MPIHNNSIHALAAKLYKIANDIFPKIMSEVFKPRDTPCHNLRHTWQSTDPLMVFITELNQCCIWDQKLRANTCRN